MNDMVDGAEPPQEWVDSLARSEAQIAAGQTVPGDVVMQMIRETLARMEARASDKLARDAAPGR